MVNPRTIPPSALRLWLWFLALGGVNGALFLAPMGAGPKAVTGAFLWLGGGWVGFQLLEEPPSGRPEGPPAPFTFWAAWGLAAAALGLRLFFRDPGTGWPLPDETHYAYNALETAVTHHYRLFYNNYTLKLPPFPFWFQGLWFKLAAPGWRTFWLFPAVLSTAGLWFAARALRRTFDGTTARLGTILLAFSFWPVLIGRQNLFGPLLLLWTAWTWDAFGTWLEAKDRFAWAPALTLTLALCLGFGTTLHWPVVAFFFLVLLEAVRRRRPGRRASLWIMAVTCLSGLAFLAVAWRADYFQYPSGCLPWSGNGLSWPASQATYLVGLFWNAPATYSFGPLWSGLYNPLLGAAILLGAVEALRQRRQAVPQALGLALFLFALPGFSTRDVEFYRLVLLILPLTVLAALGLTVLTASLPRRPRILALALLLAASTGWDTYHWAVASPAYFRSLPAQNLYAKPLDRIRAFQVLSQKARRDGPGLFLNELIPNAEQDLMLMTYPFNAARNPALSPERAQWWAILVNANLGPFLAEEFPSMAWHRVSEGLETRSGGILLGIGPLQSGPENRIDRYLAIQRGLVGFQSAIMRRSPVGSDESLRILDALHPLFRGDRFLETTYWENREVACELGGDREGALEACQGAVRDGYPAAHLFFKMGLLCLNNGDSKEAAGYFRRALACPFNLTPARLFLDDFGRPAESK